jgi:hypothetical protein
LRVARTLETRPQKQYGRRLNAYEGKNTATSLTYFPQSRLRNECENEFSDPLKCASGMSAGGVQNLQQGGDFKSAVLA